MNLTTASHLHLRSSQMQVKTRHRGVGRLAESAWVAPLSDELLQEFADLATRLSPEWLTCDGELSAVQANRRYRALRHQWHALERKAGRAVTEDEVWAWEDARRKPREVPPDAHLEQDYEDRVSGGWEVGE